jgi:hypothetical protein
MSTTNGVLHENNLERKPTHLENDNYTFKTLSFEIELLVDCFFRVDQYLHGVSIMSCVVITLFVRQYNVSSIVIINLIVL